MAERLVGQAIYKVKLISGREERGGHDAIISPGASIFGMTIKDKIRWDLME